MFVREGSIYPLFRSSTRRSNIIVNDLFIECAFGVHRRILLHNYFVTEAVTIVMPGARFKMEFF